jgi:hypothetical protein
MGRSCTAEKPRTGTAITIVAPPSMETLHQLLQVFLAGECASTLPARWDSSHYGNCIAVLTRTSPGRSIDWLRSNGFTRIRQYALLPSVRSPRWLIPVGRRRWTVGGLHIYTPFASRARLLKRMLVSVTQLGYTGWARHKVLIASRQPLKLESLVREVTGESNPIFALSLGTPGRFQKLTIQAMRPDGDMLGYVKLPMTLEAIGRIRHEATMLKRLRRFAALWKQIPQILYAGDWGESCILFQSAGASSPAPVEFTPIYEDFLQKLQNIESVEKPGRALVEEVRARWRTVETGLDSKWKALGVAALLEASHQLENLPVRCAVAHGDFAPWNCRISGGQLCVFDWEFSSAEGPVTWDAFHFQTQVACLLNRETELPLHFQQSAGSKPLYLLYLLNSAGRLLEEDGPQPCTSLLYRQRCIARELSGK